MRVECHPGCPCGGFSLSGVSSQDSDYSSACHFLLHIQPFDDFIYFFLNWGKIYSESTCFMCTVHWFLTTMYFHLDKYTHSYTPDKIQNVFCTLRSPSVPPLRQALLSTGNHYSSFFHCRLLVPFLDLQINGVIWYKPFCAWVILLNMKFLRFIMFLFLCCISCLPSLILLFFFWRTIFHCKKNTKLFYSLSCFQFKGIMGNIFI